MTANNLASVAAAIQNIDDASLEALVSPGGASHPKKHAAAPAHVTKQENQNGVQTGNGNKIRNRRASDGAYLGKIEGKRVSGELKCDKCGKGYKHSSCLTKHLLVYPFPSNPIFLASMHKNNESLS